MNPTRPTREEVEYALLTIGDNSFECGVYDLRDSSDAAYQGWLEGLMAELSKKLKGEGK